MELLKVLTNIDWLHKTRQKLVLITDPRRVSDGSTYFDAASDNIDNIV